MTTKDRVLIRIDHIDAHHFLAIVPAWDPYSRALMPVDLLPNHLSMSLSSGDHVIARVNLGARTSSELNPSDFEEAPEPADLELVD
ncbi:MAG TPA: hypothetical protein VMX56_04375 [Anaerolineales bacterium]|nr:hypothetical protein [Anaerolineales bacterium]